MAAFERCVSVGGVALFPADTVYGLATDPDSSEGVRRLYALKGRLPDRPAAVMFFGLEQALEALAGLGPATAAAVERLLPGAVTLVLPNPARRFPLACGPEPERLGLRVPALTGALAPLTAAARPVLQSSANRSGAADVRRIADVEQEIRAGVDLILDGGELPGTASTVVDLGAYEETRPLGGPARGRGAGAARWPRRSAAGDRPGGPRLAGGAARLGARPRGDGALRLRAAGRLTLIALLARRPAVPDEDLTELVAAGGLRRAPERNARWVGSDVRRALG